MESQVLKILKKVLSHAYRTVNYEHHSSIMLAGDPGIGKTTFVKTLSEMFGMKLVTIEVPHISEEHLINIPFIMFDPETKQTKQDLLQLEPNGNKEDTKATGYKLVLAHSNLYTLINNAKKLSDAEYLQHMNTVANPHIKELFTSLGGTETKIPEDIAFVREHHNVILFLDEYWRQTTMRIRNVLREILNNNIGIHKIPDDAYIIYASNMRDSGGLEPQPPNAEFRTVEFKPPTKNEWFAWLKSEFLDKGKKHVDLKPEVLKAFEDGMDDADISHTDPSSQVRTSPRRWAQLIMYVNTAFPPADEQEAKSLLHNVGNYFIHYGTEEYSEKLRDKVKTIVSKLITKHTKIKTTNKNTKNDDSEWRESFSHYIEQYKRAGGARKHVPVISGPPGIGKTMFASQIAAEHGLRLIEVPASGLSAEDVIGMPLPGKKTDTDISVRFSVPKLHKLIMDKIEKADRAYIESLKGDSDKITAYKNQKWKYLIFFDEINTVGDEKTFNALRRVLLEKNFGPSDDKDSTGKHIDLELPKEAIVFAALNPEGSHTREITDHFRDVIDIIPAKANWEVTKKWLMSKTFENKKGGKIDVTVKEVAMNILEEMINRFKTKEPSVDDNRKPFTLQVESATLQISPREYSDMFVNLVHDIDLGVKKLLAENDDGEELAIDVIRKEMDSIVSESLEDSLNNSFYREQFVAERDDFAERLPVWIESLPMSMFNGLLNKKIATTVSLSNTLEHYLTGKKKIQDMPEDEHITNNNITLTDTEVIDEVVGILKKVLKTPQDVDEFVLNETENKVEVNSSKDGLSLGSEKASKFTNFALALLFTLHIYNFNNSRLGVIAKATAQGINKTRAAMLNDGIIDEDKSDEITDFGVPFRTMMHEMISDLNKVK
jgi:MoxR-like ATPase